MQCVRLVPHLCHSTLWAVSTYFHVVWFTESQCHTGFHFGCSLHPVLVWCVVAIQWNSFRVRLWGNTSVMNIFVRVSGELTGAHCSWICTWRGILRCYGISGKELLIFGEYYWCICIHHSHWRSGGAELLPISTDALNVSLPLSNPFEERRAVVPKLLI